MKQTPCKYLVKSFNQETLHCPFRNDCYYSHVIPSTNAPYIFPPRPPPRPRRQNNSDVLYRELERLMRSHPTDELEAIEIFLARMRMHPYRNSDGEYYEPTIYEEESEEEEDEEEDEEWDEDDDEDVDLIVV
ncbi:hypothetical protein RQP46_003129 [Phenoliferia psychrophenolica]